MALPQLIPGGSSPLTRGKPTTGEWAIRTNRLIPAHAGKTSRCGCCEYEGWAHPRSRGENYVISSVLHKGTGSSPLTRGKRVGQVRPEGLWVAHPRSRGENHLAALTGRRNIGSSPLTRGKPPADRRDRRRGRLIPAHAGKTCCGFCPGSGMPAHPRSRGENAAIVAAVADYEGSSPLTRGKHFLTCAFTAQIDQILETLELAVSSGSYSIWVACATDAPQDQVRSIGLVLPSSRGAS